MATGLSETKTVFVMAVPAQAFVPDADVIKLTVWLPGLVNTCVGFWMIAGALLSP